MNKLVAILLGSFAISTFANASTPCNGFEFSVKNNLADDLLVTTIKLNGADIQPSGFEKLNSGAEQVFKVNNSNDNVPMTGEFILHTISLPTKTVKITFNLENKLAVCEHSDTSPASDYSVEKTRKVGKVDYTISNK